MVFPEIDEGGKDVRSQYRKALAGVMAAAGLSLALLHAGRPGLCRCRFPSTGSPASARPPSQSGVSGADLRPAFRGVNEPDPEVLEKARYAAGIHRARLGLFRQPRP